MRVFLAGATGVLGQQMVPLLVRGGHTVAGMTRSQSKAELLESLGAEPVICDVFDVDAVRKSVVAFRPDIVLNELTDLPDKITDLAQHRDRNARMRREGTRYLLAAADAAKVPKVITQSVAWDMQGEGAKAVAYLEYEVLSRSGIVVRYGQLYGPGTFYTDSKPAAPYVSVAEAARRTVALLDAPCGIVTVVEPVGLATQN